MPIIINGYTGIDMDNTPVSNSSNVAQISNLVGFKNYIINGNFDVWQYKDAGLTYPQTSSGYGSDDRWQNANVGSTKTHSQVACTDTERALFNASYFSRTVVTSVAGSGNFVLKQQSIENVTKLAGKTVTVSFWAKADSAKNIEFKFYQGFGTGGTPSASITNIGRQLIALTTTWQKKTITVTIPSTVGKTLGTDGVHTTLLGIRFIFDAGSGYDGSIVGQQSGTFDIAQVQLEEGTVATPFEQRPIGLELSLCHRYFWNAGLIEHTPKRSDYSEQYIKFPVSMRVAPTIALTAYSTLVSGNMYQHDGSWSPRNQPFTFGVNAEAITNIYSTGAVSIIGAHYAGYITASAEL